jgi:hypothetical protein
MYLNDDTYLRVQQTLGQNKPLQWINNRWLLMGSLLLFALLLNREGDRFPTGNEFIYLLYFWKAWHPYLSTDWTFQETTAGHAIFNIALGWTTRLMSLKAATWVGRVVSWVFTFAGLFRVGRHFKIPPWAVWVGIILWLAQKQSPVTGEWMVGSFEAKVVAYPCLLFAIDAVLMDRSLLAGVLCGIAFSFHSAVGMWGGAALGFVVLVTQPFLKTVVFSIATIFFSLPGLYTSWSLVAGKNSISLVEAKYLTTCALADCFDWYVFSHTWMVVLVILPIFAWMHSRWRADDRQVRQLLIFQIALAIFFVFGAVARVIGRFDWVELFPMRVYAVFALLLFYWQGMSIVIAWMSQSKRRTSNFEPAHSEPAHSEPEHSLERWTFTADLSMLRNLSVFAILLCLLMPSPLLGLKDLVATHFTRMLHPYREVRNPARGNDIDFANAALWISNNTNPTDVVIAPPWWNDAYYLMNRPLIANWHAPRYNRITEWKNRLESLVGDTTHLDPDLAIYGEMDPGAWAHYAALSTADIQHIRDTYHDQGVPKYLVTTGTYPYTPVFTAGTYRVYQLP